MTRAVRLIVAATPERTPALDACLRTYLPSASVAPIEVGALTRRELPDADCAVVASGFGDWPTVAAARALRAAGFERAMVALTDVAPTAEETTCLTAIGVRQIVPAQSMSTALAPAVVEAMALDEESTVVRELRHAQRMIATGEVARGIQHSINNPLTALLAEAQLLEMEEMAEEQLQAVRRIVELCRRVAGVVRKLDVVAPATRAG